MEKSAAGKKSKKQKKTESQGRRGRVKKLCHRPRWVILSIAWASVGKVGRWGWVFTVRLSSCRWRPYISPSYGILSFIDAEQSTLVPPLFREWRARAGQTTAKFDRWNRPLLSATFVPRYFFFFSRLINEQCEYSANSKINDTINNKCMLNKIMFMYIHVYNLYN